MARRRFFVSDIRRGLAELTGSDAEHLVRVLRVEPGERYEISDNQSVFLAEVRTARKSLVVFETVEPIAPQPEPVHLTLVVALFKFDRLEWLIEKATELGVSTIRPFAAVRTERGLAAASIKRYARWKRIVLEASQQARRDHLPEIEPTAPLRECLQMEATTRLLLDEERPAAGILQQLPGVRSTQDRVAVLLGPEGGWASDERAAARTAGWLACSLGPLILRAETAGIAALAAIGAAWLPGSDARDNQGVDGPLAYREQREERST